MTRHITDYMVQELMEDEFDKSVLHDPLFPVNMRLFKTSKHYYNLIGEVIDYIDFMLRNTFEGYTKPRGMSGANLGIPWNIIGVYECVINGRTKTNIYINPVIVDRSDETETVLSNCGSIRLPDPIQVIRYRWIDLEYYDEEGEIQSSRFHRKDGGFTIQHEVDHNLGILITDLQGR